MKQKLKVGFIGCGAIAVKKHLPGLQKLDSVDIIAFCNRNIEKAKAAAREFGTADAKIYGDYREMLKDAAIDVVHVCTPNASHAEITIAALEAGKHVMCEKPMAKTSEEAKRMLAVAEKTKKKLSIGYNNRFRADSQYLHKAVQRGDLGEIYYAKAHAIRRRAVPTWGVFLDDEKQGGGPLIDIGSHALDLTLWMMDNYSPQVVMGSVFHKLGKKKEAANAFGPWDPEAFRVEDSAFGFIKMQNGATVILESSWALNTLDVGEGKCSLSGTEGGADMMDGLRIHGEDFGKLYTTNVELDPGSVAFFEGKTESAEDLEMRTWIEAILNNSEPVVKADEALVVTQILEAIYESAKMGKAVYFD
ncbi:Gfo/Idh/MocA family protein [Virgibacillus halodenitrificans]|uniref:Gfo/Idh/MocA family protein n=1 Tax=Virgibacillus halodenitrificans TaxID=1482 RepID=UPI00045D45BA|nr:Gfo/Idh/MocA family oxidoreductase [Virgibacillus halodenitrificans]CDQ31223.1 putative oxidoreductase YcjS [Virgibacillus halodenitrificans]